MSDHLRGEIRPRSNSIVLREMDQLLGDLDTPGAAAQQQQQQQQQPPSRLPRSNSLINAEIEQMITDLQTADQAHHARVQEIRHSMPFFAADAELFRRAGVLGSREAVRLQGMSRNALAAAGGEPLTAAGKRFVEQLPVVEEGDFPDETSCGICMEAYGSTDDLESRVGLPCGHLLGRRCVERWLGTCNTCPLCRRVLFEEDGESEAFLELQEILQRLGPAVTTLFLRLLEHVAYAGTEGSSIEDVVNSIGRAASPETDPSPNATTTVDNPEEAVPITENELEELWTEVTEICHQLEALETRVTAYNSDAADGQLGPESDAEFEQIFALNEELFDRWEDVRWEMMEMHDHGVVSGLLGPERQRQFRQLAADIALRTDMFRLRRQEMMEMRGDSPSRVE